MNFKISALPAALFQPLFGQPEAVLEARGARRVVADRSPGFPCRVSLRDAAIGEPVLLVNYAHLPVASPYQSRYAVYVRERASEAHPEVNEVPEQLRRRLLSVRAFDGAGMLLDADVVEGEQLESSIERLLGDPRAAYLHLHNAKPGCYAARVDRA